MIVFNPQKKQFPRGDRFISKNENLSTLTENKNKILFSLIRAAPIVLSAAGSMRCPTGYETVHRESWLGGPDGNRTRDLFIANEARYQLRYRP